MTATPTSKYLTAISDLGGHASVTQISIHLGVYAPTVRNSLTALMQRGKLIRPSPGVYALPDAVLPTVYHGGTRRGRPQGRSKYLHALRSVGGPATTDDVANAAYALGHSVPTKSCVYQCLQQLMRSGQIKRVGWGLYEAA